VKRLSDNADRIDVLHVSPDGKWALAQHTKALRYTYDNATKPEWYLHDLKRGSSRRALVGPKLNLIHVVWTPDSKGYYAVDRASSKPHLDQAGVLGLVYEPLAGGVRQVPLGWERGLASTLESGGGLVPLRDGSALVLLADGVRTRVARYRWKDGKPSREWLTGEHAGHIFDLAAMPDGRRCVYVHMTASKPPVWHVAGLNGSKLVVPKAIAPLNGHLANRRIARSEVVTWKGAAGDPVEGILYYPHGYVEGRRYPLLVQIHGGPASADFDNWDEHWATPANLICQRGAFVFRPNYHGSSGYGRKWLESIADGKYCEPEVEDIEKGVDALIARGLVDKERMGLQGWSNGAILTNVLITKTTRYRAAVSGAGTVEYVSDWASCEFGEAFDRFYLGKSPLEDLDLYRKKSPFHDLSRVRTPTLILFGTEDRVVHPQQGWALYRGLQQLGKVPVRFVQYPGEKHRLKKLSSQRRNIVESLAWLDRYLFTNEKPVVEALKADSPLAWALKRLKARKVGKLYGESVKGTLVPEVVRLEGLNIGRFEVTRAQFAQFDPSRPVAAGKENYPVGGVTCEQARAYCAWLSKKTGKRYRLPTIKEAEKLYEGPRAGENTLDAWAGYAVNPDDARVLREKLGELGEGALIKEVGLGRGTGKEDLVFDLGGNVAEWVDDGGKGRLLGGSADSPGDLRAGPVEAGSPYRGFRVVLD
jgi:poly(3-hydroxybutyrate) depolymerase